ncbi:carotenoid 1,2-hydratase [Variovorax dokdonensis]|uniref:Carotenoid 1,2-hydratase n=2 Tax=Variovorax dokdonensis TaxID=344883 RepID=A0ABT7NEP0_9BURK|nr:carotenoid 1,2-hydratase [Variovorax dokdonensis]MDM0046401.1 carotenoid 1,2-hydratase [Variovorax dokdonensis]
MQGPVFPRDFGSHPEFATEWWYITGNARTSAGAAREFGFQLTFFRSRVAAAQPIQSAFAARQLIFAHAAITDLQGQRQVHDQRIARAGMGVAFASEQDTDVQLRDWRLRRDAASRRYEARLPASDFGLSLNFAPTQPVLLQGKAGLSQKGPEPQAFSHYYSEPQLSASGTLQVLGQEFAVQGRAWLDHEWSDGYLPDRAVGWDWIGMNLDDGSALMAFIMRDRDGKTVWAGGSFRDAAGARRVFAADEVHFAAGRVWQSAATQARYPVEWTVGTPSGTFVVRTLLDNQELDSRGSTGTVYWEGLCDLLDTQGQRVGRGYLEMTGYAAPLKM